MVKAGIDIGAHSIRLSLGDEGLVFEEPALGAFNSKGDILAIGNKVLELKGKSSDIIVQAPIREGRVDLPVLEAILDELCYEFKLFRLFQKTVLVVSYPTVLSEEMIDRLKTAFEDLGADELYFNPEIWLSAIGAGLDLFLPVATSVMNIGYSNCDIAIFRNGQMEAHESHPHLNGETAAKLVHNWLVTRHNLEVSAMAVDQIVQMLGNVRIQSEPRALKVRGIDRDSKQMAEVIINENEVAAILAPLARDLSEWVCSFLHTQRQPVLLDMKERGIIASGGTMKIQGLADTISTLADCPVYITDQPDHTALRGIESLLKTIEG